MTETPKPLARSARVASWFGKFAPSCALAGLIGIHLGIVPPLGGFMFFQLGLLAALGAIVAGGIAFFATRDEGEGGAGRASAWLALASGTAMIAITVIAAGPGLGSPPINDITTDLEDPPSFASAADVADYAERDMSYPAEFVEVVRDGYPDLQPIDLAVPAQDAFRQALEAADRLGWKVVYRSPETGRFDAQDQSMLFKFVDDVTVRVVATDDGARIDVRSKSRDGRGDLGVNAKRIRAFRSELTED